MLCNRCGKPMSHVVRFEKGKSFELERCPYCHIESKPVIINTDSNYHPLENKTIKQQKNKNIKKSSKKK